MGWDWVDGPQDRKVIRDYSDEEVNGMLVDGWEELKRTDRWVILVRPNPNPTGCCGLVHQS